MDYSNVDYISKILIIIRDIFAIIAILWGVTKIYILHKQKKEQDFFKKKIDIFNNYIKSEFGTNKEYKNSLSEIGLIAEENTLDAIIKLKRFDKDNDSLEEYHINLLKNLRNELSPGIKSNKNIIKDYIGILTDEDESKYIGKINNNKNIGNSKIVTLGKLFEISTGYWISSKKLKKLNGNDNYFYYIKIRDIENGRIKLNEKYLLEESFKGKILNNRIYSNGFFVISTVGTIGKIGYYQNNKNEKIILSSNVCGLIIKENSNIKILEKYLLLFFKTDFMVNQLNEYKRGIAQQFLKIQDIAKLKIFVLNIEEQEKIIEKNEEEGLKELNEILNKNI